jgi:hypothetical protein
MARLGIRPTGALLRELDETGSMKTPNAAVSAARVGVLRHRSDAVRWRAFPGAELLPGLCMTYADTTIPEVEFSIHTGRGLDRVPSLVAGCVSALPLTSKSASAQPDWTEAYDG